MELRERETAAAIEDLRVRRKELEAQRRRLKEVTFAFPFTVLFKSSSLLGREANWFTADPFVKPTHAIKVFPNQLVPIQLQHKQEETAATCQKTSEEDQKVIQEVIAA